MSSQAGANMRQGPRRPELMDGDAQASQSDHADYEGCQAPTDCALGLLKLQCSATTATQLGRAEQAGGGDLAIEGDTHGGHGGLRAAAGRSEHLLPVWQLAVAETALRLLTAPARTTAHKIASDFKGSAACTSSCPKQCKHGQVVMRSALAPQTMRLPCQRVQLRLCTFVTVQSKLQKAQNRATSSGNLEPRHCKGC